MPKVYFQCVNTDTTIYTKESPIQLKSLETKFHPRSGSSIRLNAITSNRIFSQKS